MEELKKDKLTLREFMKIKDKTIKEANEKIESLTRQNSEIKQQMNKSSAKYEAKLADLTN